MTTSLLDDAFRHHIWANERIIDECEPLTPEQLKTPVPGAYGSIIDTLRHAVRSDVWYLSFFRDDQTPPDGELSLAELRSLNARNGTAWTEVLARELDPDEEIAEIDDGWELHSPVGVRLAQVVHHGTDHRSQVCSALTSLGVTPPEIDVWAFARASGRERALRLEDS
jgi:uncharacterized damage-inducible protein DinB